MTSDAPLHPEDRLLGDFASGALEGQELDRVAAHLELCESCRDRIDGIVVQDDLLNRLRKAATLVARPSEDQAERRQQAWALRRRLQSGSAWGGANSSALARPAPPREVANYEIVREVGRGGMGVVYQARHKGLRRLVALKMILAGRFASESERQRFQREAELAARLQHPNIVRVYEAGVHDGHPFLVMEWIEGITLADRIGQEPWPPPDAARLIETLALAIDAAHRKGVIHRDLKPSNILLETETGGEPSGPAAGAVPKIADFGLARAVEGGDSLTSTGLAMGTPEYMAPEQANHEYEAGPAADVYALGAMLYQLVTARVPFVADTPIEVIQALCTTEPVSPRRLRPSLPRDLETITLKSLEKEPLRRYPTAGALADDLRRYLSGEPIEARPPSVLTRVVKWARRRPSMALLTAALAAVTLLALIGLTFLWRVAARERDRATAAAVEAARQGEAERRARYTTAIAAASAQIELNNVDSAREFLDGAPAEYRNWEWQHFSAQLDNAQAVFRRGEGAASVLATTPSGKLVAYSPVGGRDVRLRAAGEQADLHVLGGLRATVSAIEFSPDGSLVAAGADDGTIGVWGVADGRRVEVVSQARGVASRLAMPPDGSCLASCTWDGDAYLWDLKSGRSIATFRAEIVQFGADSRRFVSVEMNTGNLTLRDAASGEILRQWTVPNEQLVCVALSQDGRYIAAGSRHPANLIRLWDIDREGPPLVLEGHRNTVNDLVFSQDGRMLASMSSDTTVRLWDMSVARCFAILRGHNSSVRAFALSPDGRRLVTASSDRTVHIWDTTEGTPLYVLRCGALSVVDLVVSRDASTVLMSEDGGGIYYWDVEDAMKGGLLLGHTSYVYDLAFAADGRTVASAAWDGTVRIWDAGAGRQEAVLRHSTTAVTALSLSPDGRRVASVGQDGMIRAWDLGTGTPIWSRRLDPRRDQLVEYRVAYSPLGDLLAATGGQDRRVLLLDAGTGEPTASLAGHETEVSEVAFSPDGSLIVSADWGGSLRFWNSTGTGRPAELKAHPEIINKIAFSPDGKVVATASRDRTVRLWDVATRRRLATLRHGTIVYGLSFKPDGTRLAAACEDGTVRLWDPATYGEVAELRCHNDYVHAVAFSPDGSRLATGSGDYTVRVLASVPSRFRDRPEESPAARSSAPRR